MNKQQKVAIITGASQGIGAGLVKGYRDAGYAVIANSRSIKPSADSGIVTVAGDIADRAVAQKVVETAIQRFGRIDTLVNNAGVFIGKPFTDYTAEDYRKVIHVNLDGFFHVTQLTLPRMLKQKSGSIVSISGTAGKEGMALRGSLCAAKWGLLGLTQTIAKESGPSGVRANVICPGGMDEPDLRVMYAERAKGLGMEFSQLEKAVLESTPLRKYASHDEVAKAALFLVSSDSSHTTGESLNVSGGRLMS